MRRQGFANPCGGCPCPSLGFNLRNIHNRKVFDGHTKKGSAKSINKAVVASTLLGPSPFCAFASPVYSHFAKVSGHGPNAPFDLTGEEYGNAHEEIGFLDISSS